MKLSGALRASAFALIMAAVPMAAQAETLRQALEAAYSNNPTIMSALLSVKATAEDIARAKASKLPQIDLNASSGVAWSVTNGRATVTEPSFKLGLDYRQNVFDNFQSEAAIEGAR